MRPFLATTRLHIGRAICCHAEVAAEEYLESWRRSADHSQVSFEGCPDPAIVGVPGDVVGYATVSLRAVLSVEVLTITIYICSVVSTQDTTDASATNVSCGFLW